MSETLENCGHCHKCGSVISSVLDGEEWCGYCQAYRRYKSHGWAIATADANSESCPKYYGGGHVKVKV